jgi:O-antigen/teichoic acid export membrane protein
MSVRRNVVANSIGVGWTTLMGIAFIPLYVKLLGIEAYGLIAIFVVLQTWLSLLDLGLTPTVSREMARFTGGGVDQQSIRDLLRSIESVTFITAGIVALGIWLASGWLSTEWFRVETLPRDLVASALAIMGLVIGLRFVESIYRSSIIGLQRQVALNVVVSITATVRGLGAVAVLALVSPTITAFFLWQCVVSVGSVCVLGLLVHRSLPEATRTTKFSLEPLRHVWRFAAGALLVTSLGLMLSQSDKVILSPMLTLTVFAIYSLAYTAASAVRLLALPIDQAVFPRFTQLIQMGDELALAALYHKATQYSAVLLGSAGFFLVVFGREVLALWMQDDALAAEIYAVLWILTIGMVLNGLMNTPYYLQMAAGWTNLLVRVNAVMVILFVPLIYILTQRFAVTGAAVAWVLLNVVYVLGVVRLMHRRLLIGEMRDWYMKDVAPPLLAAAAAALILRQLLPTHAGSLATLVFLGLSMAGILVASGLAAGIVRRELVGQLRIALRRA